MAGIQTFSGPCSSPPACLSLPRHSRGGGGPTKGRYIWELRPADGKALNVANIAESEGAAELSFHFSLEMRSRRAAPSGFVEHWAWDRVPVFSVSTASAVQLSDLRGFCFLCRAARTGASAAASTSGQSTPDHAALRDSGPPRWTCCPGEAARRWGPRPPALPSALLPPRWLLFPEIRRREGVRLEKTRD